MEYDSLYSWENNQSIDLTWERSLEEAMSFVLNQYPIILFGPPGTGKSWMIGEIIRRLEESDLLGEKEFVQFHKKFSYEDFIEGYTPIASGGFKLESGVFKSFCDNLKYPEKVNIFVIDEINRAELSTTLGEVLYLIEDRENRVVKTSHSKQPFSIPKSLAIIGSMNTADRNISNIDFAARRRFKFIPIFPDYNQLHYLMNLGHWDDSLIPSDQYVKFAQVLNQRISTNRLMGRHMQLGQTMLVPENNIEGSFSSNLTRQFIYTIIPQIETYCGYGNESTLHEILNPNVAQKYLNMQDIKFEDIQGLIADLYNDKRIDN